MTTNLFPMGPARSEVVNGEAFSNPFWGAMAKTALAVGNMTDKTGKRTFEERREAAIFWMKKAIADMEAGPQHTIAEVWSKEEWANPEKFEDSWDAEAAEMAKKCE
jgi:hypothetical protein